MVQIASGAISSDRGGAGLDKTPPWDDPTVWTNDFDAKVIGFPQIVHWYQNWHTKGAWNVDKIHTLTERGELPMLSWAPRNPDAGINDTTYNLASINAGTHDAYMSGWARDAAAYGGPMLFRPMWEMNGSFYSWGVGVQGQTAADYVAAFRRMVDIFRSNGATNVKWIWCPLANGTFPITDMYPGNTYVDYTGLDGYNYMASTSWQTVAQVFDSAYNAVATVAPTKPFIISEVGCMETNGDKAAWITDLFNRAHTNYTNTRAIIWFDVNNSDIGEKDWRINTTAASLSAFDTAISKPENSGAIESGVQFVTKTEISNTAATSVNISIPVADLASGDVMVLDVGGGGFHGFLLDDTGWETFADTTDGDTLTAGNARHTLYWKRYTGAQKEVVNVATQNTGVNRNFAVALSAYRGCKETENPISDIGISRLNAAIAPGTLTMPVVTTTGDRQRVVGSLYIRDGGVGSDLAVVNWPTEYKENYEVATLTTDTNSQTLTGADTHIPNTGTDVTPLPTITNSQIRYMAVTFSLIPEPVVPTVVTKTEKIKPTNTTQVVGLTPTDDVSATAIIDDDPYASDGQFLAAADPGGGGTVNAYAESHTTHPFGVAGVYTNPQNAYGSTEGNFATSDMATRNSWYGNLMTLANAMAALPNDAVISNFLCRVRWQASGTGVNGVMGVYSGGTLLGETTSAAVGTTLAVGTYSTIPAQPTVAQLKSPTFGIGIRTQRTVSQARTFNLDWIKVEFTYTAAGSTIPITVEVEMGPPSDPLAPASATVSGSANVLVRKKGGGGNPPLTIELRQAGVLLQTIANAKPVSDAIGQVVVAAMDQTLITDPASVQLRITSPGVSGGVVEVGAVEWAAQVVPPAIGITWDASTAPDLLHYNLYRSTVSGGPYTKVNTDGIVQPEYTDLDVVTGTDYYYVVTAVDTSGNESARSAEVLAVQGTTTISLVRTAQTTMRPIQNIGMRAALAKVRAGITSVGSILQTARRIKGKMATALTHVAPLFESATRSITVGRNSLTYLAGTQNVLSKVLRSVRTDTSQVGAITQAAQRVKAGLLSAVTSIAPLASAVSRTKTVARIATTQVGNLQNLGSRLLRSVRTGTSYVDDILQGANRVKGRVVSALTYVGSLAALSNRTTRLHRLGSSFLGAVQHAPSRVRAVLRTGSTYVSPLAHLANTTKERLLTALTYVGSIPQGNARVKGMLRSGSTYIGVLVQLVARTTQLYRLVQSYVGLLAHLASRSRGILRTGVSYIAANRHAGSVLSSLYRQVGTYVQSTPQGAQRALSALRAAVSYVGPIAQLTNRLIPVLRTALTYVAGSSQASSRLKALARSALTYLNVGELSNRTTVLYRAVSSYVAPIVQLATSSLVVNLVRTALTTVGSVQQVASTLRQAFRTLVSYVSPLNQTASRLADKIRVASNTYVAPVVQQGNRYAQAFKTALTWMTSGQAVSRIIGKGRTALTYLGATYHAAQRRSQLFRLLTTTVGAVAQRSTVGIALFLVRTATSFVSALGSAATRRTQLFRAGVSFVQSVQNVSSRLLASFRSPVTSMAPIVHIGRRTVARLRNTTTFLLLGSAASRVLGTVRSGASYVQAYHTSSRRSTLYRNVTSGVASIVQAATRSLALNLVRTALTVVGALSSTATTTRQAYRAVVSYVAPVQSATTRLLRSFRSVSSFLGAIGNTGSRFLGFARSSVSYVAGLAHLPSRLTRKVRSGLSYLQALHETSSRRSALYRDIRTGVGAIWQAASAIPAVVMLRSAVTYVLTSQVANRAVALRRTVSTALDFIRHLVSRITSLFRAPGTGSGEFQNQSTSSTSRPRTAGTHVEIIGHISNGEVNLYVPPQAIPIVLVQTMKKPVAVERRKGHVTVESVKKPVEIVVSEGNIS